MDITDRKRTEEQLQQFAIESERRVAGRTHELQCSQKPLRALASELTLTEQRERRRLATELHDYLAQLLVASRLKLSQTIPHITDTMVSASLANVNEMPSLDGIDATRLMLREHEAITIIGISVQKDPRSSSQ